MDKTFTSFQEESAGAQRIAPGQNGNRIENTKCDLGDCLVSSGDWLGVWLCSLSSLTVSLLGVYVGETHYFGIEIKKI